MEPINIICATNARFVPAIGVMLTSLLRHTAKERHVAVYLIYDEMTPRDEERLRLLEAQHDCYINLVKWGGLESAGNLELRIKNADYLKIFSQASFWRLYVDELLPHVDKAIYIDGDILCLDSVAPLYDTPIDHLLCAAVEDMPIRTGKNKSSLRCSEYINAGVLLMNLKEMRKHKFSSQVNSLMAKPDKHSIFFDQDIINEICNKQKLILDFEWNFQYPVFDRWLFPALSQPDREMILRLCKNKQIRLLHFCGPAKPWTLQYTRFQAPDLDALWRREYRHSLWHDSSFIPPISFCTRLNRLFRLTCNFAWRLTYYRHMLSKISD